MDTTRFEKIAEYLADKYVALQEQTRAVKTAQDQAQQDQTQQQPTRILDAIKKGLSLGHKSVEAARPYTGESQGNTTFNIPLGIAGGVAGYNQWTSPDRLLKSKPFQVLSNPNLQSALTNPYEKFVYDLLKQQENIKGGDKRVGKLLYQFRGKQNIGQLTNSITDLGKRKNYQKTLLKALAPFIDSHTVMKDRFNTLISEPIAAVSKIDPAYWDNIKTLRNRITGMADGVANFSINSPGVDLRLADRLRQIEESLREAKTPEVVRSLSDKLRRLADSASSSGAQLFSTGDRDVLNQIVKNLRTDPKMIETPASSVRNLAKTEDIGRAIGKITNSVHPSSGMVVKPTVLERLKSPGKLLKNPGKLRGGVGALVAGLGLPMALDIYKPNRYHTGFIEPPKK
jgi:hypothetical protein